MDLTEYDRLRYSRQMLIEGWGEDGQLKLKKARVFVAGAGGLGSPVSLYLAAAGVGEIRICDNDRVELSNLNRQILHSDERLGELKAVSAAATLNALNPEITVIPLPELLDENSVERLVGRCDVVVDCLDNYETRYLLNWYCLRHGIPFVHGGIWGLMGQVSFIHPPETPCLRCLVPKAPPKGVFPALGATPGLVGSIQAMEALKYLAGVGSNLKGKLLIIDGNSMDFFSVTTSRNPSCPDCGDLT